MKRQLVFVILGAMLLSGCTKKDTKIPTISLDLNKTVSPNEIEETIEETVSDNRIDEAIEEAVKVKGIYVTGPIAGHTRMQELMQLVEDTELNAMVIDIKNDEGYITYHMQSDKVIEIGASQNYIKDIELMMKQLKEKNIYTIARIVAFKDPVLAAAKPELSIKTKTGQIFYDKGGLVWVNPYDTEVWEYLLEVATQAAQIGFDEIQFDYVRFSTDVSMSQVDFGEKAAGKSKEQIITEFMAYAHQVLKPLDVKISADVFGTVIDSSKDAEIVGQNYSELAKHMDIICPMVYPSHYGNGVYGIPVPDAEPYKTILKAMQASKIALSGESEALPEAESEAVPEAISEAVPEEALASEVEQVRVRPWLQDFTASWVPGHIKYGAEQIRTQIQAVYDGGYEEWILWNASNRYTDAGLLPANDEIP